VLCSLLDADDVNPDHHPSLSIPDNWYNSRLDPQRDSATFVSSRSDSCPIKMESGFIPDRYITTNRATYKYPSKPIEPKDVEFRNLTKQLYDKFSQIRAQRGDTDPSTTGIACSTKDGWLVAPSPIPTDGTENRRLFTTTHTTHGGAYSAYPDNRVSGASVVRKSRKIGYDDDGLVLDITDLGKSNHAAEDRDALDAAVQDAALAQEIARQKRLAELTATSASVRAGLTGTAPLTATGATGTRRRPFFSVQTKKEMTCEAHISAIEPRPVSHMAVLGGEQLKLRGDPKSLTAVQRAWIHNPLLPTLKRVAQEEMLAQEAQHQQQEQEEQASLAQRTQQTMKPYSSTQSQPTSQIALDETSRAPCWASRQVQQPSY